MSSRLASGFLRFLLSSPLHGLASRRLMLLTVIGRRTGRRYTFPVGYSIDGRSLTVVAGAADRKTWWLNVVHAAPVVMRIRGRDRNGIAHVVWEADEADRALRTYVRAFPLSTPRRGEIVLDAATAGGGGVAVATAAAELREAVVVRIALTAQI
jgi:deazaflavin-dependent oxidoreductase (nitroreductase family)